MAWMQHRMPVHLNGAVLSDTYIRLTIRLPRNGDKLFLCRAGRHPQLWFTLQTWYLEHENQHRVQVSSPKNPPWPAAMSRFHQRCISSRAQGCTSSNRGFDFEGISLSSIWKQQIGTTNKIKQDACGIPGNHKKDTEVTTNFSNTVETRNTDGVTHNSSGHKCQVADLSINNIYWSLICTSCYTVHVWCTSVSHIYIYWSLLYTTPVLLHSAGTWYHITRSNLWQIQNNMLKTAIEI